MAKRFEFIKAAQRSPEWLALRSTGVGASDIPAILGISPYKTPYRLWAEKRGEAHGAPMGAAAQRGVLLEDAVGKWYEEETGAKLRASHGVVRLKAEPWAMASLDRTIVGEPDGLVEIKTSASPRWTLYPVPPEVVAQVQWQMFITGAKWVDVVALLGGLAFKVTRVAADEQYQQEIFRKAKQFHEQVQSGVAPSPAGTDSDVFALLNQQTQDEMVLASDAAERLAAAYEEAAEEERIATERMQDLAMELKQLIGDKAGIMGRGWSATWKTNKPSRKVDWKAIAEKAAIPEDVIEAATLEVPGSRVFRFKRRNQGE